MLAIFFALISYLGWGIGDIFGTIVSRKIGGYSTTFWYLVFQVLLFGLLAPIFLDHLKNLTTSLFILNFSLGVIGTAGLIAFYEGMRIGNPSLVGTIVASFAAIVVILSRIFLKESIDLYQLFSILIIFLGLIVSSLDFKDLISKKLLNDKSILLALFSMLLFGIYWTFIKIPIQRLGWFWPGMISLSTFPIVLIFLRARKLQLVMPNTKGALLPLAVNSLLLGVGSWSFNIAIEHGLTSIVAPIAGSYSTLFVILAFLFFKDPITKQQIVGIITTLIGIVLLSVFSV